MLSLQGVVYQDFIALLTAALRETQGRLEVVEEKRLGAGDDNFLCARPSNSPSIRGGFQGQHPS